MNINRIIITEPQETELYFPLNLLRPVFDVKFGMFTFRSLTELLSGRIIDDLLCDERFYGVLNESGNNLKINRDVSGGGLVLVSNHYPEKQLLDFIFSNTGKAIYKNGKLIAFHATDVISDVNKLYTSAEEMEKTEYPGEVQFFNSSWDAVKIFKQNFTTQIGLKGVNETIAKPEGIHQINPENISISQDSVVMPGSVLDASAGKVIVEASALIEPYVYIKGPAYIGKNVTIKTGTKIYGPVYIGYFSKVSGEISSSIFHSLVNKQHDGFTGDSYFCPFVNLGADTVTSNLKNNYSYIRVKIREAEFNSGMQFLGSLIGDHSKTSINTMLNTGSIVGAFANIFGAGFHPKFINSFTWNESGNLPELYDFEKAMITTKAAMSRRQTEMSDKYMELCKMLYDQTSLVMKLN